MPAPITSGIVTFLQTQLDVGESVEVWDGEIPRWDPQGMIIDLPNNPIYRLLMPREGFNRESETFENPYNDQGMMLLEVYGTTRTQVENALTNLENILLLQTNWSDIDLGVSYQICAIYLVAWSCYQLEQARTKTGTYVYQGDLHLKVEINGTVKTR